MTSLGELISRADFLLEKYEKYDTELKPLTQQSVGEGFENGVRFIENEIRKLSIQANEITELKNRATVAAKNAEIRRAKTTLLQERIPELQKKLRRGKNVTTVIIDQRSGILEALKDAIHAIPDGVRLPVAIKNGEPSTQRTGFTRVTAPDRLRSEEYRHTDESRQFAEDWEASKRKQDEALHRIEQGVGVLGNLARDMDQEIKIQNPVLDAMEEQLDRVKGEIKTRNAQLRGVLNNLRSSTNICFDMLLIIVLLALAAYIYSLAT
eukprot:g8240.t1